jgi:hypothetical protein
MRPAAAAHMEIREEEIGTWLDAYGRAWEERDPVAIAGLFTEDASYYMRPSPFAGSLKGREAIVDYWRWSTSGTTEVSFEYEVLAVAGETGAARWSAWIREDETIQRVDGIFVVALSAGNRCHELREWWNTGGDRPETAAGR